MDTRELILLSPYRLPTQNTLMIGNEDVGAFLNGYTALWHPAVALGASAPPRIGSPYDYEQPAANHVYAVPDSPPLFLPDDWDQRVRDAGAVVCQAARGGQPHAAATADDEITSRRKRCRHFSPLKLPAKESPQRARVRIDVMPNI